ncbi:MAG: hypothetical protein ACXAC8_15025 [Candidatus Hodarchaeales archaeon]|jgi:hypothetical protein
MHWKHTLGQPGNTYIIGRHWVKKNLPKKKNRIAKDAHNEACLGVIYDIGFHYLPDDPSERKHLWICMETGELLKKAPSLKKVPKIKTKVKKVAPKVKEVKPPVIKAMMARSVEEKPISKPTTKPEPVKPVVPATPSVNTLTPVSEVKGIGKAVFDKLTAANIETIGDLLSKHSQEIATMIGRKSDAQIKKWQETAQKMLQE